MYKICVMLSLIHRQAAFEFEDPVLDTSGRLTLKRKVKL
jgi:hypothetical protein